MQRSTSPPLDQSAPGGKPDLPPMVDSLPAKMRSPCPAFVVDQESYAVYEAVLKAGFARKKPSRLVIVDRLTLDCESDPVRIENRFTVPWPVVLFGEAEREELRSGDFWDAFYRRYEGAAGLIELSRVTFRANRTEATVELGNQRHWEAGNGLHFELKKKNGQWHVRKMSRTWVS